jgi:hypothetical protein
MPSAPPPLDDHTIAQPAAGFNTTSPRPLHTPPNGRPRPPTTNHIRLAAPALPRMQTVPRQFHSAAAAAPPT